MKRNGIFVVFALWLLGCSTAQKPVVLSPPKAVVELPPEPVVMPMVARAAIVPQTNAARIVQWKYADRFYDPLSTNSDITADRYLWSLEGTKNFSVWTVVTNYPKGYSGETPVTNDWGFKWYRMHGKLP